jgi:hypothetical protein
MKAEDIILIRFPLKKINLLVTKLRAIADLELWSDRILDAQTLTDIFD